MNKNKIRPIVICVFRNTELTLVAEGYDSIKDEKYYRPIGGGIEYGESSFDALKREVKEEIGAEIKNLKYLGAIESIFTYNGDLGHEIVMVYDADFVDQSFYTKQTFEGIEDDGQVINLMWISLQEFQKGNLRLVPEDLLKLV